jgi:hypothetical protein
MDAIHDDLMRKLGNEAVIYSTVTKYFGMPNLHRRLRRSHLNPQNADTVLLMK